MANRDFTQRAYSLDRKRVAITAPISFGAAGAPILEQWYPPQGTAGGYYGPAPEGGIEGVIGVYQLTVGIYVIALQDSYQRLKTAAIRWRNRYELGMTSPVLETCENFTSPNSFVAFAGIYGLFTGTALNGFSGNTAGNTTTITAGGGVIAAHALTGATITDGTTTTTVTDNTALTATSGTITTTAPLATTITGTGSSTAWTVANAAWLVNTFAGMTLVDTTGAKWQILSNTATSLMLSGTPTAQSSVPASATLPYWRIIDQRGTTAPLTYWTVTGTGQTGAVGDSSGTTFTPDTTVNWQNNQFAGMYLTIVGQPAPFLIASNNTTAITTVATLPTLADQNWYVQTPIALSSVGFTLSPLTAGPLGGAPAKGTLALASGTVTGALTSGTLTGGSDTIVNAAMTKVLSGATIGWSSNVGTISHGGAAINAHALAGGIINDGTLAATIIDNTAITATTGQITVMPIPAASVPTGTTVDAYQLNQTVTPTGTVGTAWTGTVGTTISGAPTAGSLAVTGAAPNPTNPTSGEFGIVDLAFSDTTVVS